MGVDPATLASSQSGKAMPAFRVYIKRSVRPRRHDVPAVIVVGGAPASGKTTLAKCLAREFNVPLIAKDTIKEALMDADPPRDREASSRLGAIAFAVLFRVAGAVTDQGVSVLVEATISDD